MKMIIENDKDFSNSKTLIKNNLHEFERLHNEIF